MHKQTHSHGHTRMDTHEHTNTLAHGCEEKQLLGMQHESLA